MLPINVYPYLNLNDLNLDYILKTIGELRYEVTNFVSLNAIKYADPIQWDITHQYEKNTIVIDPLTGVAYISVAPVPMGVALTNTDFWTVVFDLGAFIVRAAQNFTDHWESDTTTTATFNSTAGDWLVWGDVLYKAKVNITAGDTYVIDSNIEHFTMEDLYTAYINEVWNIWNHIGDLNDLDTVVKDNLVNAINEEHARIGDLNDLNTYDNTSVVNSINSVFKTVNEIIINVKDYGAVGDGVTDDSDAINAALTAGAGHIVYVPDGTYLFHGTIAVHSNTHVILSDGATLLHDYQNLTWPQGVTFTEYDSSVGGYDGVHDCIFEGGTLDMGYPYYYNSGGNNCGVLMVFWHNKNITIKNVTFTHTFNDHCIECNSSKNVVIDNCHFVDCYSDITDPVRFECINTDWATSSNPYGTMGLYDNTALTDVIISNCSFTNVINCIGSHGTNWDATHHKNIQIIDCVFNSSKTKCLDPVNWDDSVISNCRFYSGNVATTGAESLIQAHCCDRLTISGNTFDGITHTNLLICYGHDDSGGIRHSNHAWIISNNNFVECTCNALMYMFECWRYTISDNIFDSCDARGVQVRYGGECKIVSNTFTNTPSVNHNTNHAVYITNDFETLLIANNVGHSQTAVTDYDFYANAVTLTDTDVERIIGSVSEGTINIDPRGVMIDGVMQIYRGTAAQGDVLTLPVDITKYNKLAINANKAGSGSAGGEYYIVFPWQFRPRFSSVTDNHFKYNSTSGENYIDITANNELTMTTLADLIRAIAVLK